MHNHNDEPMFTASGVHSAAPYVEAWTPLRSRYPDLLLYRRWPRAPVASPSSGGGRTSRRWPDWAGWFSIFEPGLLRTALTLHRHGRLPAGMVKLYFGGDLQFGLPPTPTALDAYLELLAPTGLPCPARKRPFG
ncbi:hypothetical protein [Pseudonocardia xishanensis]|uniref:Uncharacterized protein n=1 Tax=Pseudonocardia xishanensis TaxID=630995 RepID=A0ABP8RWW7_9PSEU